MRVERAIAKESTRKSERANRAERTIVNERATRAESTKAIERAERTRVKSPALTWEQKAALNRARFAHRGAYVPAPSYPGPKPGGIVEQAKPKRALPSESTSRLERATVHERTKLDERAVGVERTSNKERATRPESTTV